MEMKSSQRSNRFATSSAPSPKPIRSRKTNTVQPSGGGGAYSRRISRSSASESASFFSLRASRKALKSKYLGGYLASHFGTSPSQKPRGRMPQQRQAVGSPPPRPYAARG